MMAFLRNSSYNNTLAIVKYKEITTPTHIYKESSKDDQTSEMINFQ